VSNLAYCITLMSDLHCLLRPLHSSLRCTHPPSFSIGMFMAALYTGHMGTGAEQTLFDKCFVGELKALHTGVEVEVNGTLYFIQARLIQHRLDTKAIGKFLYVHEANSSAGCPLCSDGRGTWDAELRKVVYGDRRGLCMMHALRRMGNSRHCCPGVCKAGEKRSKVRDTMERYNQGDEETDHSQRSSP
jgi:hypothetical protein